MKKKKSLSSALLLSAVVLGTVISPLAVAAETTVASTTEASTTQAIEAPTTSLAPSTELPATTEVPATTVGPTTTEVAPATTSSSTTSVPTTTAEGEETPEQRMKREALEREFGIEANVLEGIVGKDNQYRIRNTKVNPYRKVVRVYMQFPGGGSYVGSGTMIAPDLVLTAGHNVYDINKDRWASKVQVVPAQNGNSAPYGTYTASNYFILRDYKTVSSANQFQYDVAVIKLSRKVSGVGYLPISKGGHVGQRVQVPGYPSYSSSKDGYMYTMFGNITQRERNLFLFPMDTEAGQSGGPILNSKNQIVAVNVLSRKYNYMSSNRAIANGARRVDSDVVRLIKQARSGYSHIKVAHYKEKSNTVYRLYHSGIKRHLYTKSLDEANTLTKRGWKFEGAKFKTATSGKPVYRLYHGGTREHIYTTNVNERNTLRKRGWRYEGVAWYSTGKKPIYRLYHKGLNVHLYTADKNERNTLVKKHGWKYEGVAFRVK